MLQIKYLGIQKYWKAILRLLLDGFKHAGPAIRQDRAGNAESSCHHAAGDPERWQMQPSASLLLSS